MNSRFLPIAAAAALALSSGAALAQDGARTAGLFTQTVTQGAWDPAGYAGFAAMAKEQGLQASYLEHTSYEAAPAALRQLASDGVNLIIAHSSGYSAAMKEVAPDFPDTQFVLYSYEGSTDGIANYSAWSVDWDEYGFILGALAASASKAGHIAVIAGEEIPSAERTIEFIQKGAVYVNPDVQVDTAYVGSFTDVARAREIATGIIARGADFVIPSADTADAGIQQAADEEGALTIGSYADQSADYPNAVMTSTIMNFDKSYADIGKAYAAGELGDTIVTENLASDGWTLARPFAHVDPSVEETVFQVIEDLKAGKINLYAE
ncbi:MAG: BMP family ABC transporter substrate-binding protein [Rhodobacteraceae bacterium]|nr:BMP family ABC transporter substrate-binding protein [Paracoccaceae bacterium]MAY46294.1 BMP family ABC transporter substrate-binding protein [Paracoccaceae bacterium]QEW23457.1 Purine-binding protein precursor [Paracoccaceae bacterium]